MKRFVSWNSWREARIHLKPQLSTDTLTALDFAFDYAIACHGEQKRANGQPYVIHLLQVVEILVDGVGINTKDILLAGVLHDIIEDTSGTLEEIGARFGEKVAHLVNLLSIPRLEPGENKKQVKDKYLAQLQFATDEAIVIKLADRYSNVQRLERDPRPEHQKSYYRETVTKVIPLTRGSEFFGPLFKEWQVRYSYLDEENSNLI